MAEAESPEGYTLVAGVRELSDGRILLADRVERFVYLLGPELSREDTIGTHGRGPGEYLLVNGVFPLEGDSSALGTDRGYLILTPELRIDGVLPRERSFFAVDRGGYLYGHSRPTRARLAMPRRIREPEIDSVTIVRWHRDRDPNQPERVGAAPVLLQPAAISDRVPFQPQPQNLVSPEGVLAIAHPEPYHVEMIRPDGPDSRGPNIDYEPLPLTEGHKEAWREERRQARAMRSVALGGGRTGEGLVVTARYPVTEPPGWPELLPPFLARSLEFDTRGRLWVRRTTDAGLPPLFDVFDGEGRRIRQVRLPQGTRLVGFGDGSAYVVRRDELHLEYLQRVRIE